MSESAPVSMGLCFHEFELDLKSGKLDTDGRELLLPQTPLPATLRGEQNRRKSHYPWTKVGGQVKGWRILGGVLHRRT